MCSLAILLRFWMTAVTLSVLAGCEGTLGMDLRGNPDSSDTADSATDGFDTASETGDFIDTRCGDDVVPNVIPFEHPPWQPFEDMPDCMHVEVIEDCAEGWCRIPRGCFVMGSPFDQWERSPNIEDPLTVILDQDFEIMQFELTRSQWLAHGFQEPEPYPNPGDLKPCEALDW